MEDRKKEIARIEMEIAKLVNRLAEMEVGVVGCLLDYGTQEKEVRFKTKINLTNQMGAYPFASVEHKMIDAIREIVRVGSKIAHKK